MPTSHSRPLLARGVYRAHWLSPQGKYLFFAVDAYHRLVEGSRVEVDAADDPEPVLAALWRMLDDADPENSRRAKVREAAQNRGRQIAGIVVGVASSMLASA